MVEPGGYHRAEGQVRWRGTTNVRLSEGRISEVIATSWDHLGILQQLEAVDSTEPRTGG